MNKQKGLTIAISILLTISIISGGILLIYYYSLNQAADEFNQLTEIFNEGQTNEKQNKEDAIQLPLAVDDQGQETLEEAVDYREIFSQLHDMNNDIAGWISIPGTQVNYPIMHTPEKPDYYLYRNFEKEYSLSGVPFIDGKASLEPRSDNLLIHGHNMKNGSMFAQLLAYKDEAFLKDHPTIEVYTLEKKQSYDIISVFPTEVYNSKVFNYHNFINAKDEKEFDHYVESAKKYSLFDTGITAHYGDQLMTLSTCAYHTTHGRFVVIAKARNEEQDKLTKPE